jgi:hypothetical protein
MTKRDGSGAPARRARFDVRVSALLVGGGGLVFLAESLIQLSSQGAGILELPIIALVLQSAAAAIILTGNRMARPVALIVVILAALMHMVILLGEGPVWTRIVSGLLAAAQMYALVLLNTKPVRAHFGLES